MPATTLAPALLATAQVVAGLSYPGQPWPGSRITYSFPDATSEWPGYGAGEEQAVDFHALSPAQQANFRAAMAAWDDLIAPSFTETDDHAQPGLIRVGFSGFEELDDETYAYAYSASTSARPAPWEGDIWIASRHVPDSFAPGRYAFEVLLHEIGHALGLKHPFEAPELPAAYDDIRYTLMSYTRGAQPYVLSTTVEANGAVTAKYQTLGVSTPMVLDVAVIQAIFGADPDTAKGDTVYRFSQDTPFLKTLYDAGGADTLDLSGMTRPSNVDLAPGAYSSIGYYSEAAQIADLNARYPGRDTSVFFADHDVFTWSNNLGIALNTVIESVFGGTAADTITGNFADNWLWGGGGADFIRGLDGSDQVDGQAGNDDVNGNMGADVVHGGAGADFVRGGQGNDQVFGDDGDDVHVNGNLGEDVVHGGAGNDTVYGGQGADVLFGDEGDDQVSGDLGNDTLFAGAGNDILLGGAGADRFVFTPGSGADWVGDFNAAAGDRVQVAAGVAYTILEAQGQAVISLGGGDQIGLAGVKVADMGDWLAVV